MLKLLGAIAFFQHLVKALLLDRSSQANHLYNAQQYFRRTTEFYGKDICWIICSLMESVFVYGTWCLRAVKKGGEKKIRWCWILTEVKRKFLTVLEKCNRWTDGRNKNGSSSLALINEIAGTHIYSKLKWLVFGNGSLQWVMSQQIFFQSRQRHSFSSETDPSGHHHYHHRWHFACALKTKERTRTSSIKIMKRCKTSTHKIKSVKVWNNIYSISSI